jgi:hypothetical protein
MQHPFGSVSFDGTLAWPNCQNGERYNNVPNGVLTKGDTDLKMMLYDPEVSVALSK